VSVQSADNQVRYTSNLGKCPHDIQKITLLLITLGIALRKYEGVCIFFGIFLKNFLLSAVKQALYNDILPTLTKTLGVIAPTKSLMSVVLLSRGFAAPTNHIAYPLIPFHDRT
jgi:hypothetical protein